MQSQAREQWLCGSLVGALWTGMGMRRGYLLKAAQQPMTI
jgi:hypothetical protein